MTTALVTGAAGAVGAEVVRRFEAMGYDVMGVDLPDLDITDRDAVRALPAEIDVCANVAGLFGEFIRADQITTESWDRYLAVNLTGHFNVCQRVLPHMRTQGYGRIVNVASIASLDGNYRAAHYAAAKAGLIGLTRSIALEYAASGVTANAVMPGIIDTPNVRDASPPGVLEDSMQWVPAGRCATVEEVAALIAFLASPEASYVNGAAIPVDGAALLLQFRFARKPKEHSS